MCSYVRTAVTTATATAVVVNQMKVMLSVVDGLFNELFYGDSFIVLVLSLTRPTGKSALAKGRRQARDVPYVRACVRTSVYVCRNNMSTFEKHSSPPPPPLPSFVFTKHAPYPIYM